MYICTSLEREGRSLLMYTRTDLLLFLFLDVFGVWLWSLWSLPVSLLQILTGGGWGRLWEVRGQHESV